MRYLGLHSQHVTLLYELGNICTRSVEHVTRILYRHIKLWKGLKMERSFRLFSKFHSVHCFKKEILSFHNTSVKWPANIKICLFVYCCAGNTDYGHLLFRLFWGLEVVTNYGCELKQCIHFMKTFCRKMYLHQFNSDPWFVVTLGQNHTVCSGH